MPEFEELYRTYFPRIYMFLYKLCKNEGLAEELTQETFYQAFTSFHRFKGNSEVFTWLASIAKHTYYKFLRKNKLQFEAICIDAVTDVFIANTLSDKNSPDIIVQRNAVAERIKGIVNKIPEKYREVIILRVYAQLSFAEVASAMKISENSAKVIYFRAKKMLMEELKDEIEL